MQTRFPLPGDIVNPPNDDPTLPWSGADNTNQFFDLQELFNPNESSVAFTNRLLYAGNAVPTYNAPSTYNRYTYYRLASQMGVESAPEQDKIDLNYSNAFAYFDANGVVTNITFFPGAETNFTQWTPLQFFTVAADKMLREYSQEWQVENPSNFVTTFSVTNAFSITNIPVLVSNRFVYTPSVQRVLQLAANIYDATTNNTASMGTNYPSVFRPIFWVTNENGFTNVYVNGYQQVGLLNGGTNDVRLNRPVDITSLLLGASANNYPDGVNVYGVPWIVGAKKGFPNFNEFSMENVVGITRRLQVTRPAVNPATSVDFSGFRTNQMYTMTISNQLGVECWNSYTNNYVPISSAGLTIVVRDTLSMVLTNDDGMIPVTTGNLFLDNWVNIANTQFWPGVLPWDGDGHPNANSFDIPLYGNVMMQLNPGFGFTTNWWAYRFDTAPPEFLPTPTSPLFETGLPDFPQFGLMTTNRLQVFMLDGDHVIDYAQFAGPDSTRNLNAEIFSDQDINSDVWLTNASTALHTQGVPDGILNQLRISRGIQANPNLSDDGIWRSDPEAVPLGGTISQQQAFFDGFFRPGNVGRAGSQTAVNLSLTNQAPYNPTRYVILYTTWQANDPLVHYTASDLNYTLPTGGALNPGTNRFNYGEKIPVLTDVNLGHLNNHYTPWGRALLALGTDTNIYNFEYKDPLVWQSQDWDFPTYKLPTVGWLGRVHRGTPWQTVYLKAPDILQDNLVVGGNTNYFGTNTWVAWTGDSALASDQFYDAANTAPVQDWLLFDNFTTAFDDNATRGTLSVNVGANDPGNLQAGLAAWSALFSGVIALSNNVASSTIATFDPLAEVDVLHANTMADFTWLPVNPAGPGGMGAVLGQIVTNINLTRATFVNADGLVGAFEHAGDVLSAPALTVQSPFLNLYTNGLIDGAQLQNGVNDEMYEWLPQQVMSLLRVSGTVQSPVRYVIYSYGQTLKPAPNGIYTGNATLANGQSAFGMVTNYQVVAEAATRTVLRYDGNRTEHVFQINEVALSNWLDECAVDHQQPDGDRAIQSVAGELTAKTPRTPR